MLLLTSAVQLFATEGLKLSLQCSNVILTWPSVNASGDTYLVRRRPDLSTNSTWTVLTNSFPAASGTNLTVFIDYGVVTNPNCGVSGGSFAAITGVGGGNTEMAMAAFPVPAGPMAMPINSAGSAVPVALYPPGFDLSGFLIFDPTTGESISGSEYSIGLARLDGAHPDVPQPYAGSGNGAAANLVSQSGFYEVVKLGVHLFGVTNGMVLSGHVPLKVEYAGTNAGENLVSLFLSDTDTNFSGALTGTSFTDPASATNGLTGAWDTTQIPNGTYTIQLGAILSDGTFILDHAVTVTVSNVAWTPDPWSMAGFGIYVGVQTIFTNGGTFVMEIYDDQADHVGHLNGIIGSDGYLDYPGIPGPGFTIDNTDGNGNQLPSTFYNLIYAITPAVSGNQSFYTPELTNLTSPFPYSNSVTTEASWNFTPTSALVIYQEVFSDSKVAAQSDERDMMDVVSSIEYAAGHAEVQGFSDPTLDFVYSIGHGGGWQSVIVNGLTTSSCRDFVYFGHGAPSSLGSGSNSAPIAQIAGTLINALPPNTGPGVAIPNQHPYRFVFLDGCDTAEGDWPLAFGIPKQEGMTINDFLNKRGLRARAFMGWNRKKQIGWEGEGTMNQDHINYITKFWQTWDTATNNIPTPLNIAIQAAGVETIQGTGQTLPNPAAGGMVVYGAADLTDFQ
jgi:hypothetical protein